MPKSRIDIFGKGLSRVRARLALTQREMAEHLGISETRVRHIESADKAGVFPSTFRELAKLAGKSIEEMMVEIGWESVQARQKAYEGGMNTMMTIVEKQRAISNVHAYSEMVVPGEPPLFEMSVAAGPWTDVTDVAEVWHPGQIAQGLFRIRIAGDSMEPVYQDGAIVEFRCMRDGRDGLEAGRRYYVQKRDGLATFKVLEKFSDDEYILRAINRKKYPKPMTVLRAEVVRMARAVAQVKLEE